MPCCNMLVDICSLINLPTRFSISMFAVSHGAGNIHMWSRKFSPLDEAPIAVTGAVATGWGECYPHQTSFTYNSKDLCCASLNVP